MNWYKKAQSEAVTWEDSQGQIMWIKGDTANSPLTWIEMKEAITMKDQTRGSMSKEVNGVRVIFIPPFKIRDDEDLEKESAIGGSGSTSGSDQIYSEYDVIQSREDIAPSRLRKRKKRHRKNKGCNCKGGCKI